MLSVWTSNGIIDKPNFIHIQEKIDSFLTPSDIGRIPLKISSGFSGFTAEQWRNWTLIYSLCSLKEILPHRHYDCWLQFVKATSLLCRHHINYLAKRSKREFMFRACACAWAHFKIMASIQGEIFSYKCTLVQTPLYLRSVLLVLSEILQVSVKV